MRERRQEFRRRVYYGCRLAFNDRKSTLDCIVRNFSQAGARVEVDEAVILPDELDLAIERRDASFLARIVWRRQREVGLALREHRHLNATMTLGWALRVRASERVNKALRAQVQQLRVGY